MSSFALFAKAYAIADSVGKGIYLLLFALSFVACWVAIEKCIFLFSMKRSFEQKLYEILSQATIELLEKNRHFIGLGQNEPTFLSKRDIETIREKLHCSIDGREIECKKYLFILSTSVSLAPFIGILGTVWGLLIAFSEVGGGAHAQLLAGLSTALATTVIGLLIAIPSMVATSYLKSAFERCLSKATLYGEEVIAKLELNYRKVDLGS